MWSCALRYRSAAKRSSAALTLLVALGLCSGLGPGCKSNEIIENNNTGVGDGGSPADASPSVDAAAQNDASAVVDSGAPGCVLDDPANGVLDNCIAQ